MIGPKEQRVYDETVHIRLTIADAERLAYLAKKGTLFNDGAIRQDLDRCLARARAYRAANARRAALLRVCAVRSTGQGQLPEVRVCERNNY